MARTGRPKKEITKNIMISIRLTDEETKMLEYIVSKTGKTMSQVIRDGLNIIHYYEQIRKIKG